MKTKYKNQKLKIYILLLILGLTIIVVSLFVKIYLPDTYMVIFSIGGIFLATSTTWLIEEYYRKDIEDGGIENEIEKLRKEMEELNSSKGINPKEKDLQLFRNNILYLYYQTSIKDRKIWNTLKLDFSEISKKGRLKTEVTVHEKDGEKHCYSVELFRPFTNDNIIIVFRPLNEKSRAAVCVLQCGLDKKNNVYGVLYHDDWNADWRLSPSILSLKNKFPSNRETWLSEEQGQSLHEEWRKKFNAENVC